MTAKNDTTSTSPTQDGVPHGQDRSPSRPATRCHDVDSDPKGPVPQGLWHGTEPSSATTRRGRPKGRRQRWIAIEPPGYTELSDHHREVAIAALATLLRPLLTNNERSQRRPESTERR